MPDIKPFCALIPASHLQANVVTRPLENYSTGEAKLIAAENDCSFLHLINPELEHPYLRGTRQELIFKKIGENLETFFDHEFLVKQNRPAFYIYSVEHDGLTQTGIWALTHIKAYLDGTIKKHEVTVERRERLLADYLQQTGLDANPVLITYPPDRGIDEIITDHMQQAPVLDFTFTDGSKHQVWVICNDPEVHYIEKSFAEMPAVYIADGHHRIASMAKMGLQKQALNALKHDGSESYNYFTTVYMNTSEVKILAFNRMVKDLAGWTASEFLQKIEALFVVTQSDRAVKPQQLHEMGMYIDFKWYTLIAKKELYEENDPVSVLDVSILQNYVLEPLLSIKDPRTDTRISFEGGRVAIRKLQSQVDHGIYAVAFTLFPISMEQLIRVADASGVMPPKSTWIEPKFLVGLLTHHFS